MSVPAGYKATEVGVIPEDWEVRRLGELCGLINGRGFKPHEWSERGLPIIRIQNLNGSQEFNHFSGNFDPKILVQPGELLFAWSGSRGTSFGPHFWRGRKAVLNYHTWRVALRATTSQQWLFHALRGVTREIEDSAHGASALVHVQKREMTQYLLAAPATENEQSIIATALSDAEEAIAAVEATIAKKRALKTATMQALLSGTRRLPGFSREWEVKALGQCLKVRHGKSQANVEDVNGRYPILATGGEIGRADRYLHPGPSVLIGRKGTIDRPQFSEGPFWSIDTLFYTEIDPSADAKFLFYKFQMIDWRTYNEASGVPSLSSTTIEAIEVEMPERNEQSAIATALTDFDFDIGQNISKLEKLRLLKVGMMQQLLTGKIRLV